MSNYTKTIIRLRLVNIGEYSPRHRLGEYLTIILPARVGYEMIDSQRGAWRRVGYNHLVSNKRE